MKSPFLIAVVAIAAIAFSLFTFTAPAQAGGHAVVGKSFNGTHHHNNAFRFNRGFVHGHNRAFFFNRGFTYQAPIVTFAPSYAVPLNSYGVGGFNGSGYCGTIQGYTAQFFAGPPVFLNGLGYGHWSTFQGRRVFVDQFGRRFFR